MNKISTPELLIANLYNQPLPGTFEIDDALLEEWQTLKALKQAIEEETLAEPSETSVAIIMAYALSKEETAPSY